MTYRAPDPDAPIGKTALRFGIAAGCATAILAAVIFYFHVEIPVALHWYVVAMGALASAALVRVIQFAYPVSPASALDGAARQRPSEHERLEQLEELERQVSLACSNASDFRFRLRPRLRNLAGQRLRLYSNIDSETEPGKARALLGDKVWQALWPSGEEGIDRRSHGTDISELTGIVEALEQLENDGKYRDHR